MAQIMSSDPNLSLDLAIVDGGHDIGTARSDLLVFEGLLRAGGYLWLDDFENANAVEIDVNMIGRDFSCHRRNCMRFLTGDHRGMMIHQKGF